MDIRNIRIKGHTTKPVKKNKTTRKESRPGYKQKKKLPRIGMRIIKSAAAVFICFIFAAFYRSDGVLFYTQAALWCIQPQKENMRINAVHRMIGTMLGAVFGLAVIMADKYLGLTGLWGSLLYVLVVSIAIVPVIYITLLIRKADTSFFSCTVFLSIVVTHIGEADPFPFVWNRLTDTLIGIFIGMLVNSIRLPYRKEKDTLFVLCMDDEVLSERKQLSAYGFVELNRMLDDGAQFTMSTRRTPASLLELLQDIQLKLPVIALDGAVMYDIHKHEYLRAYVISIETAHRLQEFLSSYQVNYFMNLLLDDMLIIQYQELQNEAEQAEYEKRRHSLHSHFTRHNLMPQSQCIYFMLLQKKERISQIKRSIMQQDFYQHLRIASGDASTYPGYAYLNIYNRNATKENMIAYLKRETGLSRTMTFGSREGTYDVTIQDYTHSKLVHALKRMYEPLLWEPKAK